MFALERHGVSWGARRRLCKRDFAGGLENDAALSEDGGGGEPGGAELTSGWSPEKPEGEEGGGFFREKVAVRVRQGRGGERGGVWDCDDEAAV